MSAGKLVSGRISIRGSDARAYAPDDAWVSADDGFDPATQIEETRYFHCRGECVVNVPLGDTKITAWRGQRYAAAQQHGASPEAPAVTVGIRFKPLVAAGLGAGECLGRPARAHELWRPLPQHVADAGRAGARRGSGRHLQHHREQGTAHSGHRVRRRRRDARRRRDDLPGAGVPHELLGPSRPAGPARPFPDAGFQRLSAERAHLAVSAQRCGGRSGARTRRARRLRASVRLGRSCRTRRSR